MPSIRLEFSQFGKFDSFDIVRSNNPLDFENLPVPIATGIVKPYYIDTTVVLGQLYYYAAIVHLDSDTRISDQKFLYTGFGDPFYGATVILTPASFDGTNGKQVTLKNLAATPATAQLTSEPYAVVARGLEPGERFIRILTGYVMMALPFTLGVNDFTIEFQCVPDYNSQREIYGRMFQLGENNSAGALLICQDATTNPPTLFVQGYDPSGVYIYTAREAKATLNIDQYNHVCLMRTGGVFRLYLNGVLVNTNNMFTTFSITKQNLYIGSNTSGFERFSMFFGGLRVSQGNKYDLAGFPAVLTPFENDSDVLLLLKDGPEGFKDYSQSKIGFAQIGLAYSPKPHVDDGVIYLSESGRYHATIPVLGTSDFTLEAFVILNKTNNEWGRVFQIGPNGTLGGLYVYLIQNSANAGFQLRNGSGYFDVTGSNLPLSTSTWKHVCIMRKDGVFYAFVDGVRYRYDATQLTYNISHNTLYIGANATGSEYADISINSLRLTKVARYTVEGFDPPTDKFQVGF